MYKKILICLFSCVVSIQQFAEAQTTRVIKWAAHNSQPEHGYFVYKTQLENNATPEIKLSESVFDLYSGSVQSDSFFNSAYTVKVDIGIERKKIFAFVRIPSFRKTKEGTLEILKRAAIEIKEKTTNSTSLSIDKNLKKTTEHSVLANGTWQKLAIANRGVYKVDYDFVKNTLGQSGNINSSYIRIFGNGGTMIHESNSIKQPDDLTENFIEMHDGGDGVFGPGDYFLFYANGPMDWTKDSLNQHFYHRTNLYSDSSYYFITFNNGPSTARINYSSSSLTATKTVTSFNDYAVYERELINLGLFGKTWWGETFGFSGSLKNKQNFNFSFASNNDSVFYRYQLANAAIGISNSAKFEVRLNNQSIGIHDALNGITGVDGDDPGVSKSNSGLAVISPSSVLNFEIEYQKYVSEALGYLDFIEVNTRRQLTIDGGNQLSFRDWRSVGLGSVAKFEVSNASTNTKIWEVTNPLSPVGITTSLDGSTLSFVNDATKLREYVAFENSFLSPKYIGIVPNQNLHGLEQADYIIVSHPEMIDAANKLADFHRNNNGYKVHVIPVDLAYNEFASGTKDISAIRDLMRMFYERAGENESLLPKYLLLLGQASYDYKNIIPNSAKIVPTYETDESLSATTGYCSDDYFAILDSSENINAENALMDIGVGRIPATNAAQAMAVINKIIRYKSNESLGPWRINNIYIGDNEDNAGNHLLDADEMFKTVTNTSNIYNAQKVYLDALNIISTPGGPRCPQANKLINDNVYKGAFLMNYSGHGSIYTLAHERIVTQDDYNSWKHNYKMPIMITATCDFSRFDNPSLQSAGEKIILKTDGGAIALVTTTQVVYATYNRIFNVSYLQSQFTKLPHGWNTLGEAFRIAKNSTPSTNTRKFALLGDPALIPNFPRYDVHTDTVQELIDGVGYKTDSIKSLGAYRIFGSVKDDAGNVMSNFNGKVNITFYDKPQTASVRTANSGSANRDYSVQNNIIYRGIATVRAGIFNFEFITPKDINYDFGKGKISYYADNGTIDASGTDTLLTIGGFSENAGIDNDAPIVRVFMNDSLFKQGGLTGTNSILYAIISDKSGINVSGNFVGHDLIAVLDETIEMPYVLNDYYQTAPNTYQKGFVNFPMSGLSDGLHNIRVRAWDVFNNSGEGKVVFEVLNGQVTKIRNIYNYPNPFKDLTHFVFEHNHPNEAIKVTINIFNTAGSLMKTIEKDITPTGSNTAEITWDGTGNGGEKLTPSVYPYRIRIATEKNIEDLGYQKVVLYR